MEPRKRIIDEPSARIREAARRAMKGHMGLLVVSAAVYMLCVSLPIVVVEQIAGLWGMFERAAEDYLELLASSTTINTLSAALNEWVEFYSDKLVFSYASVIFILLVPGPLTLGLSTIWLRVVRGKETYSDMVFSGFGNFLRVVMMDMVRRIFMLLWAILFVVPGIVAWYRYSLAFFLLADNPTMRPFEAITLSKYYMQQNKGNRFVLDVTFLGWFALSYFVYYAIGSAITAIMSNLGNDPSLFFQMLTSCILGAGVFAPVCAYRGVAAADYYHRVICRDPGSFPDTLELPKPKS